MIKPNLFLICLFSISQFAFSYAANSDVKKIEKEINALLENPDLKSSEFIFLDECYCKYTYEEKSSASGKYSFNYDFNLSEVSDVTYKKSGNKFNLIFFLNRPESNSISISLNTNDEKLIKEISSSFFELAKGCKAK